VKGYFIMKNMFNISQWNAHMLRIFVSITVIVIGLLFMVLAQLDITKWIMDWADAATQLGLALTISGLTYLTFQHLFEKGNREFTSETITTAANDINTKFNESVNNINGKLREVSDQLDELMSQNKILNGAIANNLIQIYHKRSEGLNDIMKDLKSSKKVKILGISLRDYFNPAGKYFIEMESILDDLQNNKDKEMKVLLINPNCEQATIRAERESDGDFTQENPYEQSGLFTDVWQTVRYLKKRECDNILAKIYNSAPSCFLVITDNHTYIEQYHYGIPRSGLIGGNFPLLKFPTTIKSDQKLAGSNITEHLNGHFDYIWDKSNKRSQPLTYLLNDHMVGTSRSAWECKIVNIFNNRSLANERISCLLKKEQSEIKLIGISLRDFFHAGNDYYKIISDIVNVTNPKIKIKALLLDPLSQQGLLRSKREEPKVEKGNLYSEVITTLRSIDRLKGQGADIEVKLYSAAPNCFAVIISEGVLVEQYHYGSPEPDATILGGKVPILEFHKNSSTCRELNGHFDFIWQDDSTKMSNQWNIMPKQPV
jgi:hypothetical protein